MPLRDFWRHRGDFTLVDNVVMIKDRVVVPKELRKVVLDALHAAHQEEQDDLQLGATLGVIRGLPEEGEAVKEAAEEEIALHARKGNHLQENMTDLRATNG